MEGQPPTETPTSKGELLKFKLAFKKDVFDIEFGADETLNALRLHIAKLTGIAAGLQKLMFKGN